MRKRDLDIKLKEYIAFLDEKIDSFRNGEAEKEISLFTKREAVYTAHRMSRDKLYDIFPELKPDDYKSLDEVSF